MYSARVNLFYIFNKKKSDVYPGQFKLDPYLVSCGSLDSVVKEVIYEANINNCKIPVIIDAYTERNKIAVPLHNKLVEIQKQWKKENSPAFREDEENKALKEINKTYKKTSNNQPTA